MYYIISDSDYNSHREWVRDYIDQKCIVRGTIMPGKMPGSIYTWMFYLRRGLFNKDFLNKISIMFLYKIEREFEGNFEFQLSGLETAATPMLASIPIVLTQFGIDLNSFVVRKDQKQYGLMNWIEGLPNEKPVLMLDDLCNSSASMRQCYNILLNENLKVLPIAFSIVNKSNKAVHSVKRLNSDMYLPEHFRMISLFDLDDFNLSNPSH